MTLFDNMKSCQRCPLRQGCNQVVTGTGPLTATLLIIGESPGEDEDLEGEPFVGRSGVLLNKLLNSAGINRQDIYISNTVKCRPPGNRKPSQVEVNTCKIWLWKELQLLTNLKVIATLGATPTALLLKLKSVTMKDIIGKTYNVPYSEAQVMPWYHPSYLLRTNKPSNRLVGAKLIEQTSQWLKKIKELI